MVGPRSIVPTMTSAVASGTLDTQMKTRFKSSVSKGDARDNLRGGTIEKFKSKIADVFVVTKARVLNGVR